MPIFQGLTNRIVPNLKKKRSNSWSKGLTKKISSEKCNTYTLQKKFPHRELCTKKAFPSKISIDFLIDNKHFR